MAAPGVWDHGFALLVFVAGPLYSLTTIDGVIAHLRRGGERARIDAYKRVVVTWFVFSLCVLALWWLTGRDWADLGIRLGDPLRTLVAAAIAGAVVAAVVLPVRGIARSPERADELGEQLGDLLVFMPVSRREEKWFRLVSTNAGLSEELIFRGYLLWYLQHFLSSWWAAALAVAAFAFAHIYQGRGQMPAMLFVASVAVGIYLYTGSLLVPVVFHILLDALQGYYIAAIRRAQGASLD